MIAAVRVRALLLLVACALLLHAGKVPIQRYTSAEGLGHNRVKRVVPDSKGFLWFCTSDGLTRFDGSHFVNFGASQGAPYTSTNDLLELPGGDYWIATNGEGVVRFRVAGDLQPVTGASTRARFTPYRISPDAAANRVNSLYRDRAGTIWLGTDGGLYRLMERNGAVAIEAVPLGLPNHPDVTVQVWATIEDAEGSIWAGTRFGVWRGLPDGRRISYPIQPSATTDHVFSLLLDEASRIWIAQQSGVVVWRPPALATMDAAAPQFREDHSLADTVRRGQARGPRTLPEKPGEVRFFSIGPAASGQGVRSMHRISSGGLYIGTRLGNVYEFGLGGDRPIATGEPFSGDVILTIGEDSTGDLWVGSESNGVARLLRHGLVTYDTADGLGRVPQGILQDQTGAIVALSGAHRLSVWDESRFVTVELRIPDDVVIRPFPRSVMQDHTGEWWMGARPGLYRFPAATSATGLASVAPKAVYSPEQGLIQEDVAYLFEDSRGDIWMAGLSPNQVILTRWERRSGRFVGYSAADGLDPHNAAAAIVEDRSGTLWIGFREGGLASYRNGRFRRFLPSDGMPEGSVRALYLDSEDRLWVSNERVGLLRFDHREELPLKPVIFSTREGLMSNVIPAIAGDRQGRIYAGTLRGLDRIDPQTRTMDHYGSVEGIQGDVVAMVLDRRERLWICLQNRICQFEPEPQKETRAAPVLISGLRISGIEHQVAAVGAAALSLPDLSSQRNALQIDYLRLSFDPGHAPLFQYRLEGADPHWSEPTKLSTVNYAGLSPGTYRFMVRGAAFDESVAGPTAVLSFRVLPPVWRRWWFLSAAGMLALASLAGFERYRAAKMSALASALSALRRANSALELEFAVGKILAESTDEAAAAPTLLPALCERTGWTASALWQLDRVTGVLRCTEEWRRPDGPSVRLAQDDRLARQAIATKQPCWAPRGDAPAPANKIAAFPIVLGRDALGALEFGGSELRQDAALTATILSVCGDIAQWLERNRVEGALRESEARFRTLAETASDAIITIDRKGIMLFVNPATAAIFGYPVTAMLGRNLTMIMPERLREAHLRGFQRYLETGKRGMSWRAVELPGLHSDGHEIALELSFGESTHEGEGHFTAVIRDVTERKRTEEALRRSREERLLELERVRRRIATDLHDDIGASLTQISVLSEVARQTVNDPPSGVERPLSLIAGLSRELIHSMSVIVWAINPQKDHLSDLVHRMRRFAADTLTARNIEFSLDLPSGDQNVKLEGNLRREVFLIFKEALHNIVRHSACTEARVELRYEDEMLLLRVRDNGRGFDPLQPRDGHGLGSMRSRAEEIGATLDLVSAPGQGSSIVLELPLAGYASGGPGGAAYGNS